MNSIENKLSNQKLLITGSGGQLGSEFVKVLTGRKLEFSAPSENELDVTDSLKTEKIIKDIQPTVIINCAAYNNVDKAEQEPWLALRVNFEAVSNLAGLCNKYKIFLVHYSSDYVFDGKKGSPYIEEDKPNPLNRYGDSKLKGEEAVRDNLIDYLLFRTSWVIGSGKQNFLYKLSEWAKQDKIIKVSADEISVPTFTSDIVAITLLSLQNRIKGLYHLTSSGYCSRYELAKYYIGKKGLSNELIPVPLSSFGIKTNRPLFSAMSNKKLSDTLKIKIPTWQEAITGFLA